MPGTGQIELPNDRTEESKNSVVHPDHAMLDMTTFTNITRMIDLMAAGGIQIT